MTLLVDTGPIVAIFDRDEPYREQCLEVLHATTEPLVTCDAVIVEACYLLRRLPGASQDLLRNVESGRFALDYRVVDRVGAIAKLMDKYTDVPMDLADACLVDLAGICNSGRILTLDGDFRIYRWARNRPFELLLDI